MFRPHFCYKLFIQVFIRCKTIFYVVILYVVKQLGVLLSCHHISLNQAKIFMKTHEFIFNTWMKTVYMHHMYISIYLLV